MLDPRLHVSYHCKSQPGFDQSPVLQYEIGKGSQGSTLQQSIDREEGSFVCCASILSQTNPKCIADNCRLLWIGNYWLRTNV